MDSVTTSCNTGAGQATGTGRSIRDHTGHSEVGSANVTHAVPLSRLFAMAFRSLGDELHERLCESGWPWVRPVHGYVLQILRKRPTTATEISALLGVTKQATSKLIDQMVEERLLTRVCCSNDARAKILQLAPRGWELLATFERATHEVEDRWARTLGTARLRDLRADLLAVLCPQEPTDLPPTRPIW